MKNGYVDKGHAKKLTMRKAKITSCITSGIIF